MRGSVPGRVWASVNYVIRDARAIGTLQTVANDPRLDHMIMRKGRCFVVCRYAFLQLLAALERVAFFFSSRGKVTHWEVKIRLLSTTIRDFEVRSMKTKKKDKNEKFPSAIA